MGLKVYLNPRSMLNNGALGYLQGFGATILPLLGSR